MEPKPRLAKYFWVWGLGGQIDEDGLAEFGAVRLLREGVVAGIGRGFS